MRVTRKIKTAHVIVRRWDGDPESFVIVGVYEERGDALAAVALQQNQDDQSYGADSLASMELRTAPLYGPYVVEERGMGPS